MLPDARKISRAEGYNLPFPLTRLPAEIRLEIYRHCLDAIQKYQGAHHVTCWQRGGLRFLALQQTSSQVRREAAPIFNREYIGNEGPNKLHYWIIRTFDEQCWILRLQAISELLGRYNPDLEVSVKCDNNWYETPSRPFAILDFVNKKLWDYVNLQLARSRREKRIRKLLGKECRLHSAKRLGFEETMGNFVVHYSSEPCPKWSEQLFIKGPLAQVDWRELEF